MTWFKIDDQFSDHPKVVELCDRRGGLSAVGLWTLAGAWCSRHDNDGRVPMAIVKRYGTKALAESLVAVGLWERDGKGYVFHDWQKYRPKPRPPEDKEKVRNRVKRHRERKRNGALPGSETGHVRDPDPDPDPVPEPDPSSRASPPAPHEPTDQRAHHAYTLLAAEGLVYGAGGVPPPSPPKRSDGRARAQLTPSHDPCTAMFADLLAPPGSTVGGVVADVLRDLEAWARLADAGKVDARQWSGTRLLTANGFQRLRREVENGGSDERLDSESVGHYQPTGNEIYGDGEIDI